MSDLLQSAHTQGRHPEPHPDADGLSAFIENALPAHERTAVLAHLAVCRDCREIVALSLPPASAPQEIVAPPERKRWFSTWSVFLPAALALAGLGAFIVYVNRAPQPAQRAQNRTPQTQPSAQQPAAKTQSTSPHMTPSESRQEAAQRETAPAGRSMTQKAATTVESSDSSISDSLIFDQQQIRSPKKSSPAVKGESGHGAVMGSINGSVLSGAAGGGASQVFTNPAPALEENGLMAPRRATTDAAQLKQPGFQDSPASATPAAKTVNVSGAQPALTLETTSANIDNVTMEASEAQAAIFRRALPSRLDALSVATHGRQVLAIDLRNAVFVSGDSGRHWETVSGPWQGRAVKASLVTSISTAQLAMGVAGGGLRTFAAAAAPQAKVANASLAGQVTDVTGASISNATVVISNSAGQIARTVTTDAEGHYSAIGLAGGKYDIEARAPGFEAGRVSDVAINDSGPATVNLALRPGAVTESVTVEAEPQPNAARPAVLASRARRLAATAPAIFEITTDNGDRWTSADGLTWQRR
jgi:predicted aspartyl protease